MPYENDHTEIYRPFTIDRERNYTLNDIPAGPDGIYPFILDLDGTEIKFACEKTILDRFQDQDGQWRFNIKWEVNTINSPPLKNVTDNDIENHISEALTAFGEKHNTSRIGDIVVKIHPHARQNKWHWS